ncbi:SMP-30/gluconolactonase/LRE family protein [Paraliomyxa miuraensis]|uniref:SMP-30/gluconolactonase/LRE family protein n=1 Tax=Paraliomyxa miuraensis TaxID=376150 RepID=UPI0022504E4C|nr:hypothetical protein [Paraliomyxa miuraensis]MCX4246966.1 hypothetical protein [Paraliomyxa miuraensis]
MRSRTLALTVGACALALEVGACRDASDPDVARGEIGPQGGLLSSVDSILTVAIQPGALEETIELTIERSIEAPDAYGPAFLVRPNVALAIPATVTYRYPLPDDTRTTAVGHVDPQEFADGVGRWRPLPVVRLDPAQQIVTATDDQLSLFYTLLDRLDPSVPDTGDTGTSAGPSTDSATGSTTDSSVGTTIEPPDTTSTTNPTTSDGTSSSTSDTSSSDSSDGGSTGGSVDCDDLPMPPFMVDEFLFDGSPFDGNSEDMTFTSTGALVVRNGPDLVQVSPAGTVTPIATSMMLPETLGLRWTTFDTIVTATYFTGELLQIASDGTVTTLRSGLGIGNGVYAALDGNIFFTDYTGQLAAYIDSTGTMLTELGLGGDEAPEANGIIYDPDRNYVYYVGYGPGIVQRVDVTDLANPGAPLTIATIPSEGGGDQVGLDGVAMDACGNLYIVDQNQGAPGSLYRLFLDAAGDPVGAPQLLVPSFPDGVANVVFAQGPGWEAYETTLFLVGLPGRIFTVDVGVAGAPTPAGG